ncbi:MAG: bifunctional phosphopantothenoylcysteine decarboxylase/phosphopantothenate--cysteine ligase CoaBC [Lentimicrobiaceae bacterium]|nr:bifunctional phosphopantothenoylcysteine decarboxylase/phosphopantothenate--cysteine ligase CoaBC [Lentimicrobiaceae bacterium]
MIRDKKILIGITGGIAAYKIPILIRLLVKAGAEVKVVVTPEAKSFVTPLTLSVLSQNKVYCEPYDAETGEWSSHIELGLWADMYLIAPLTANTMAKMAYGIADNLLLTTYLACRSKVFVAPTMDVDMFNHITTQNNIKTLKQQGVEVIMPHAGELASNLIGVGRMEEPERIFSIIKNHFQQKQDLAGKNVLITSGPTVEKIDPVRYISNHSTGKMGSALAIEAANRGAKVTFISGTVQSYPNHPNIDVIKVISATDMLQQCINNYKDKDILIFAAAVADYFVENPAEHKIKKSEEALNIKLSKTKDIIKEIMPLLSENQITVGFALETDNAVENAKKKLQQKKLNYIVLNSLQDEGAGFAVDTNKVMIISPDNVQEYGLKTKTEVATDIFNYINKK